MKKWTKTALLTGCACCIAGAALMFCGWAGGGKAYAETYDLNAHERFCDRRKTAFPCRKR